MGDIKARSAFQIARLVFEVVLLPLAGVVGGFNDDFRTRGGHDAEQAVAVN